MMSGLSHAVDLSCAPAGSLGGISALDSGLKSHEDYSQAIGKTERKRRTPRLLFRSFRRIIFGGYVMNWDGQISDFPRATIQN